LGGLELGGLPLMDEGVGFGCRWCAQLGAVFFNLSIAGGFPRAWTPPLQKIRAGKEFAQLTADADAPTTPHPTLCTTAFLPLLHRQLKAKQDKNRAKPKEQTAMAAAMATKLKHKQCKEKTQNAWWPPF